MKRKNNPWLSLAALLLLALILVLTCTGCRAEVEASEPAATVETEAETPARFSVVNEYHNGVNIRVITDTTTGAEYIVVTSGYAGVAKLEG